MFNPRILIQLPLFLIGSCVPVSSSVQSITVVQASQSSIQSPVTNGCETTVLFELRNYELPPKPRFDNVDDNDEKAVIDILMAEIGVLRKDLQTLRDSADCKR